jgi:nitroreductase
VGDHSLSLIRENIQEREVIKVNQDQDDNTGTQGLVFFLTGIIFRSSWKYRDRAYRYNLLDTGHVIENLILALKATKTHFNLSYDFDDKDINHFLGLDGEREVAFAIIEIPGSLSRIECGLINKEIPEKVVNASRVSVKETNYPIISELHESGYKIISKKDYKEDMIQKSVLKSDRWENLGPVSTYNEVMDYPEAVFSRRSSRNFIGEAMKKDHFINLIDSLCINDPLENESEMAYTGSIIPGFIAINIEKLEPGIYLVDRNRKSYGFVRPGLLREQIAHFCLDQGWLANASAHFFFLGNLDVIEQSWGPRGYRYAMMTAGRIGQRLYLAATSIGIGCCGIGAFYDNEAMKLLGLNSDLRLLYLLATGPIKSLFRK